MDQIINRVLSTYRSWGPKSTPYSMREDWDWLFGNSDQSGAAEFETIAGLKTAWIGDQGLPRDRLFLYLHGGGYQVGSIRSHYDLIKRISDASGVVGLAIEYPLVPESVFPAPIEACEKVYEELLARGLQPCNLAIAGDSAGGNLALSLTVSLKSRGEKMPAALALISPWTDLAARGESYETRAESDPIHNQKMILRMAGQYLAGADPDDPLASPLQANLRGFPPVIIQVGDRETVLDDARDLAVKLEASDVAVDCQVWPEMIHVFQQFPDELPEAKRAISDIGGFLRKHLVHRGWVSR